MAQKKPIRLPKKNVDFDVALDSIELKTDNQSVTLTAGKKVEDAISSGSLVYDLITGGGFPPGRVVLLTGREQSGKSTFIYNAMANAESKGTKTFMGDAEGSTDPNYLENIMKQYGLSIVDLFGMKDAEGNYVKKPTLRHYQPELGEPWFRLMRRALKLLPDRIKRQIGNETKWFDVWADGEEEIEKGKIQTLWFLDSLPSLMPEDLDEDDESTPMAQQARMYSNEFRGFAARLAKKRSTLICVNQIREKPMVLFGPSEYEPCGNAPKHVSSQRINFFPCSFGNVTIPTKEKGLTLEEESWDGSGTDGYKLVKLTVTKNKLFSPYKISYVRLWYTSAEGVGYGIDPVFDTAMYLSETGQFIKKSGGRFLVKSEDLNIDKLMTWKQFKAFILNPEGKGKQFRKKCFAQIRKGTAFNMYFEDLVNRNKKKKSKEVISIDDDED